MPIKVLMFGWELPPFNSGGLGVACYGLTQALSQDGVEITFVLPKKLEVNADFMRVIFADLPDFPMSNFSPYAYFPPDLHCLPPDLYRTVMAYAESAEKIAKQEKCDLIHAHDWLCYPAGIAAQSVNAKPFVAHVHATEFDRSGGSPANPAVFSIEKRGLDKAAKVIAVSSFTKNLLTKYYQAASSKVEVVHNGINPSEYQADDLPDLFAPLKAAGMKVVVFIGRLTLQKGVDYFLKAAAQVLRYNSQIAFIVVGSGDMENQLISQTAQTGISDHVLFAGFLRGNLLKQAYQSADLFVMPSVSEPFGLTALESIANGTPAIISKQSGVSEAVSHALKTDFWDVDEMTNDILSVISYPSLHKALQDNGKKEVQKVSWQAAAAKTIKVYKEVLEKK